MGNTANDDPASFALARGLLSISLPAHGFGQGGSSSPVEFDKESQRNTQWEFSENIQRLQPSATIAVSSLAKQLKAEGRDIINLSAGETGF